MVECIRSRRAAWFFLIVVFLSPHAVSSLVLSKQRYCPSTRVSRYAIIDDETEETGDDSLSCSLSPTVLYESDRILAIDKPQGIPYHDGDNESGMLSVLRVAQASGRLDYGGRIYGVHRLDRVTSGILLLAKDADMASTLTRAFREGTVTKYYVGVSSKKPRKKQGWVKGNMVRGRRKSWYLTRGEDDNNRAVTRFFTSSLSSLRESAVVDQDDAIPRTCLLFRPYTGRTHQLRVAAKSVGLPLLGDPVYRDGSDSITSARTCLHASAIQVDLDDGPVAVWSPPPFQHLWQEGNESSFDAIVKQLMEKQCDCDPILAVMKGI